jgi:hypothetical protein
MSLPCPRSPEVGPAGARHAVQYRFPRVAESMRDEICGSPEAGAHRQNYVMRDYEGLREPLVGG